MSPLQKGGFDGRKREPGPKNLEKINVITSETLDILSQKSFHILLLINSLYSVFSVRSVVSFCSNSIFSLTTVTCKDKRVGSWS